MTKSSASCTGPMLRHPVGRAKLLPVGFERGGGFVSAMAMLAALVSPSHVAAQSSESATEVAARADTLMRDSFSIGSNDGAVCQVQAELRDPAFSSMFDRAWTIVCRDAAQAVGRVYALRGADAVARVTGRPGAASCASGQADGILTRSDCSDLFPGVPGRRYVTSGGGTTYVVEGIAAYDDALKLAIASVMNGRPEQGVIRVATTSVGDADALARIQVASLPADRALAEGYRQNNSGDYASAAVYFEALERRGSATSAYGIEPSEFTLNRALQLSNLGDFAEAERLFAVVEETRTTDIVQTRLRRNFRAMNALNRRDFDGALAYLATPVDAPGLEALMAGGAISISPTIASGLNSGVNSVAQLADEQRLSPGERAILLDAQADQLTGTVRRLGGDLSGARTALETALIRALSVREGRVTSIIRLRAQTMAELAMVDEASGNLSGADQLLRDAITLVETQYPETMALASSRARYAAFASRNGREEEALTTYRLVVAGLMQQKRQLTGLFNQMTPYFRMLVARQGSDPGAAAEFFTASQLLVRPGVADTQAVLARELSGGSGDAAGAFRQANTLSREIERSRIALSGLSGDENAAARADMLMRIETLSGLQTATLSRLAEFPQYRAVSQDSISLSDLQATLESHEAYLKLMVVGDAVYAMMVTNGGAWVWQPTIDRAGLDAAVDNLRSTISVFEGGVYNTYPFDAQASHKLFTDLFAPVASQLRGYRHIVFEPDGAMLRMPINVLIPDQSSVDAYVARASQPGADPFDMRGVQWLGRSSRVSTSVSPLAFRTTRRTPASMASRRYLGMGNNTPVSDVTTVAAVRAASPDAASGCNWGLGEWNRPIPATELTAARTLLGEATGEVITGNAFTDRQIRERTDLSSYRILHFATHGLVTPPRPECPTRPALLTSFDSADSDGLLSFDEIFDLRIDADLVILSACDTAGQASVAATRAAGVTTGGGSSLDGLVRAFIGAGGRSVLASHWPVPDDFNATGRLITGLFTGLGTATLADALGGAQDELMDQAETSHPYYWAGFAIIGDGQRRLLAGSMAEAETTATQIASDISHGLSAARRGL